MITVHHYLYFALLLPAVALVTLDDSLISLSAFFDVFCLDGLFFGEDGTAVVDFSLGLTVAALLATEFVVVFGTTVGEISASAAVASSSSPSSLLTVAIEF